METKEKFDKEIERLDEKRIRLQKKSDQVLPFVILLATVLAIPLFLVMSPVSIFFAISFIIIGMIIYSYVILAPFDLLKHQVREYMLQEFMEQYHPNISYQYQPQKNQVTHIINETRLINCDNYHEEDVITGNANNIDFYLSEIKLSEDSEDSENIVFQGMLFKIKIPDRHFPTSQIQSKPGLLRKIFSSFVEKKSFGFWYDTLEQEKFEKELGPFFPFIRHLIQQQKDIRIHTKGDTITILMKSNMKFLDDPKPQLNRSFKDEKYYQKIGQQINSLLFIVEAFSGKLDKQEVVERLELKALEYDKLKVHFNSEDAET